MKKAVIVLLLGLFSLPAFSEYTWHSSTIKRIYPQASGSFVITFTTPSAHCTRTDQYHFISTDAAGVTQDGINMMLSVVLSAAALGKPVNVYFDKDSNICHVSRLHTEF